MNDSLEALVILRRGNGTQVGASRLALLRAVAELGSITAAAKAVGLSYKAAWEAAQALNNLSPRPLIIAQAGGRSGGTAQVSEAGLVLLRAYDQLEARMAGQVARLEADLAGAGLSGGDLIRSLGMRTSARNAFAGRVTTVTDGAVNAEVALDIGGQEIVAVVTRESVEALGLTPGVTAVALIKSSFVLLAGGHDDLPVSARNRLKGVVAAVREGAVNDEVTLDLGGGKSVTAVVTCGSRAQLGLTPGSPAQALIKASHVIVAVE